MDLDFAGIKRKADYSPNHIGNDFLIIKRTTEELERFGCRVALYDESDLAPESVKEKLIFSMVQGPDGVRVLKNIAGRASLVINSPQSVENCYRVNMVRLLTECGIPFPKSIIIDTGVDVDDVLIEFASQKVWIKRGDVHAVHKEDVTLAYTDEEKASVLEEFHRRGIHDAVVQEHLTGDVVKFYAVRDSGFFYWYYLNGVHHTPFKQKQLFELAQASAQAMGLYVFGGDAIIAADGWITIIDINDWPSFAPVRDEAAKIIAQLLVRKAKDDGHARA
jgi:glutathione synthase/RimK-type ligase-like ATP-grasp enzyme